jgi:eukaryotic translation initiation factor 2C
MIRHSVTNPDIRKKKIRSLLDRIPYNMDQTIKGFGIEVGKDFQNVEARIIDPPSLKYRNKSLKPNYGSWNAGTFLEVKQNRIKWCILHADIDLYKIQDLKNDMMHEARLQNIDLEDIKGIEIFNIKLAGNKNKVIEKLTQIKDAGYQFVVAVISKKEKDIDYQVLKHAAELCVGILTTCITEETVLKKLGGYNATVKNILLKLNAKLNGKNHEIDESSFKVISANSGVMFVGAVSNPFCWINASI